jgi:cyanate permease
VVNEATLAHLSHATHCQDGAHVAWYAQGLGIPFYAAFIPAVVVARAGDRLHGLSSLLLIPIVVMSSFAGVAAVSWPMWLAMSSTWPDWTVHLAALAVVGLVALVVWLAIPAVTSPRCAADLTREPKEHLVEGAAQL